MGIGGLRKRLIVLIVVLDVFGSKTTCPRMSVTARSIQSRSWRHIEWKVRRNLGAVGFIFRPWRNTITCISSDTASRVSATSTVEFFSSSTTTSFLYSFSILWSQSVKGICQLKSATGWMSYSWAQAVSLQRSDWFVVWIWVYFWFWICDVLFCFVFKSFSTRLAGKDI